MFLPRGETAKAEQAMPIKTRIPIRRISQLEFSEVAFEVMRHVFAIHNEVGRFFDEKIYKRELERAPEADRERLRREKIAEFRERFANPYVAAERGYIDAVIEPSQTRAKLITALRSLETKRDTNPKKKHGNIPL